MTHRLVILACVVSMSLACAPPNSLSEMPLAEANRALVRQLIQEVDANPADPAWIDKWLAPEYTLVLNGTTMSRDDYRQMAATFTKAFSEIQHDVPEIVAEGNLTAMRVTLRMVHTGEYEGIAATGRRVAVEEMLIIEWQDGKVIREWAVADLAGLTQQLTAPAGGQ